MNGLLDRWTTPVDARAMLATINPAWGSQPTGTISAIDASDGATTLTLTIRRSTARELVGSTASIGVELAGRRTFTDVEMRPARPGAYDLVIRRPNDDPVLAHLATHAAVGDTVHIGLVDHAPRPPADWSGTTTANASVPDGTASVGSHDPAATDEPPTVLHDHNFSVSDVRATVAAGTTILDAAEAEGLSPKFGCRRGNCRRCVVPLTSGTVTDLRTGRITEHGTHVQVCVNTATSDVAVDL